MTRRPGYAPLMIAALTLTACGGRPATSAPRPVAAATRPAPAAPQQPVAQAPASTDAQALLARIKAASDACRNFSATAFTKAREADGSADTNTAKIAWRRPGQMAAEVLAAGNQKKTGTKLLFDGKREVKVKTYFFGFIPLKITLPVDDSRLVDGRKRSLADTSTERLMDTILHPDAEVQIMGDAEAVGEPVTLIRVKSPLSWKGVDHEVFGISKRLDLPIWRDAFGPGDTKAMFHMEMRGMKINQTLPASTWTVD